MEVLNSFFTNIKDKLTNPFFGTFILVLIIHHWQLWYTVFNFDHDCTLDDKIAFITNYAKVNLTPWIITYDVLQAIFFMLLGYLIIIGTRSLVLWIEFGLMPSITGRIVNKDVVRRSEYDDAVKEREQYFDQYEEQRNNVRSFSKTIDEQTEQIKQKDEDLLKQSNAISDSIRELDLTKQSLEHKKVENNTQQAQIKKLKILLDESEEETRSKIKQINIYEELFFSSQSQSFYSSFDKFPPEIIKKVEELKNDNKWLTFLALGDFFENGGNLDGIILTEMIEKNIAVERGGHDEFTPIGKIIWLYRRFFN